MHSRVNLSWLRQTVSCGWDCPPDILLHLKWSRIPTKKHSYPLCARSVSAVRPQQSGENQAAIITWSIHTQMKRQRYTCSNKKATLRQSVSDHPLTHLCTASGGHLQTICAITGRGERVRCVRRGNRKIQQTLKGCAARVYIGVICVPSLHPDAFYISNGKVR